MNIYFCVIQNDRLTEAIDSLRQLSQWFGVEPWPNDQTALQVKIENQTVLRSVVQGMRVSNNGPSKL